MMKKIYLDLGCGKDKHKDSIGLDMNPAVNPDVLFELSGRVELPFKDNTFDGAYCMDILEHVTDIPWILSEIHRVNKPESIVQVRYPHRTHRNSYSDVTHHNFMGLHSLDHFDPTRELGEKYLYYNFFGRNFPFKISDARLVFPQERLGKVLKTLCGLVGDERYEAYLAHFLPVENVEMNLTVLK